MADLVLQHTWTVHLSTAEFRLVLRGLEARLTSQIDLEEGAKLAHKLRTLGANRTKDSLTRAEQILAAGDKSDDSK